MNFCFRVIRNWLKPTDTYCDFNEQCMSIKYCPSNSYLDTKGYCRNTIDFIASDKPLKTKKNDSSKIKKPINFSIANPKFKKDPKPSKSLNIVAAVSPLSAFLGPVAGVCVIFTVFSLLCSDDGYYTLNEIRDMMILEARAKLQKKGKPVQTKNTTLLAPVKKNGEQEHKIKSVHCVQTKNKVLQKSIKTINIIKHRNYTIKVISESGKKMTTRLLRFELF